MNYFHYTLEKNIKKTALTAVAGQSEKRVRWEYFQSKRSDQLSAAD